MAKKKTTDPSDLKFFNPVPAAIKDLRQRYKLEGVTDAELARRGGTDSSHWSRWKKGQSPQDFQKKYIMQAFGCSERELDEALARAYLRHVRDRWPRGGPSEVGEPAFPYDADALDRSPSALHGDLGDALLQTDMTRLTGDTKERTRSLRDSLFTAQASLKSVVVNFDALVEALRKLELASKETDPTEN